MKSRFVFLSVAALGLLSQFAFAQDDPRKAHAEALYNEAASLHDAGKETDALAKWREAYGVYPTPNILFSIAREEQLLGQNLAALRDYRTAIKDPLLNLKFQSVAREHVAELEQTSCRIEVHAPAGATVSIDGVEVDATDTIDVAVGSHSVVATLSGSSDTRAVNAPKGQVIKVVFESIGKTGRSTEPPSIAPSPASPAKWITGFSLIGVGVVGLAVGTGFFIGSSSASSDASADRSQIGGGTSACSGSTDPRCSALHDAASRSTSDKNLGIAFTTGGAAFALGGIAALILWPKSTDTAAARIVPHAGPQGAGIDFTTRF